MKKMIGMIMVFALLISCGGSDDGPPPQPDAAVLVFPLQNSECTTGQNINETLSQVTFEWQASANADQYTLTVVNLDTNRPQTINTQATMASLSIAKGAPFSWSVTSINQSSNLTATSDSWLFYNAGSQTTYAPFPAQILTPQPGSTVIIGATNEVVLSWSGADVEDDIETYEVYFSEQNPPEDLLIATNASTTQTNANVVVGSTYYWKIVTIDAEGNQSDSGIFDFKVQ